MKIGETVYPFFKEDCVCQWGHEKGTDIFLRTEAVYREFLAGAGFRGSAAVRDHLESKLFPILAYYRVLREDGMDREAALDYVRKETRKAAAVQKEGMRKLGNMPFAYIIYRLGVKKHMRKHFPDEGWETEWVKCNGKEIRFNLRRCIYQELCDQHNCPELCRIFCENDEISFSGLLPKIRFERTGTLGAGSACCDFHFIKGKRGFWR